eukprot:4322004-Pleurochrysis_carterae.AAC.1
MVKYIWGVTAKINSRGGNHLGFVLDSGCTHHIHPRLADLTNVVSCRTSIRGVDGSPQRCVAV